MFSNLKSFFKSAGLFARICAVAAVLAFAYIAGDGLVVLISQWMRFDEYWRFLIVPISLYLLWLKKDELKIVAVKPALLPGALITLIGCLGYIAWKITFVDFCLELGLFFLVAGCCILVLGLQLTRHVLLPLLYLLFMTSLVERVMGFISIYLQHISAIFSTGVLNASGWTIIRQGRFLRLPSMVLEIAAACSGTKQLTALMAFAVPLAFLRHRLFWTKTVLVFMALPIAVFFNIVRIILIVMWNYNTPQQYVHGPHDILLIPVIYPFALLILYLCSIFLNKFEKIKTARTALPHLVSGSGETRRSFLFAPLLIALLLLAGSLASVFLLSPRPVYLTHSLSDFPLVMNGWTGKSSPEKTISFYLGKPDAELNRTYSDPAGNEVKLYIAYFADQNTGKRIFSEQGAVLEGKSGMANLRPDSGGDLTIKQIT
ncbi:MAG: exosortase/archaeosortase family protein, partial [Chitinivibrionales bacterium]|nr:exosortase/archaeosortase family protein [Chitinivibrionales bacterium]